MTDGHRLTPRELNDLAWSAAERFWAKVNVNGPIPAHRPELGPCSVWTASRTREGYGQLHIGGKRGGPVRAHRVGYILQGGSIPNGEWVLHRCDNRACVRFSHLFLGSHMDNVRDAMAKDRLPRGPQTWRAVGERVGGARLTVEAVREIRAAYDSGAATITELARRHGVTHMTLGCVVRRTTWRHVE